MRNIIIKTKTKEDLIKDGWAEDAFGSLSKPGHALKFSGGWNSLLGAEFKEVVLKDDKPGDVRYSVKWLNLTIHIPEYFVKEMSYDMTHQY